jgi:ATP synthase protein I
MSDLKKLAADTARDVRRLEQKSRHPATWLGIVFYGGTMGLLFVVPIVAGAYLGRWLDLHLTGYPFLHTVHWTLSLIFLGIAVGAYNVYRFYRGKT